MRRLIRCVLVSATIISACGSGGGNELIGGFRSGASAEQVRSQLDQGKFESTIQVQELGGPEKPERVQIEVPSYRDLDQDGALLLGFYGDLLVRAEFRPARLDPYLEAYEASTGHDLRSGPHRRGGVEVFLWNKIEWPPPFVGWEDVSLRRHFNQPE